jgi:phosphoglucosamine mutase
VLHFGTDGVRAKAYVQLTPDAVAGLGRAAAAVLGGGDWVIGRDTRESGEIFEQSLAAGLVAAGASVSLAGVVPTPALAFFGERHGVATAMITASHNPYDDNGVKLFAPGGRKLPDDVEAQIESGWLRSGDDIASGDVAVAAVDVLQPYTERLLSLFPAGCLTGLDLILDCANGAMSVVAPQVAAALGANVRVMHSTPNGRNINDACGATHPAALSAAVVSRGAQMGLAFDGDGDRVIAVDHLGRVVDGDRLIAMAALQLREQGQLSNDTVVVTVMSNLGFHRAMEAAGIAVRSTAVGDRYVLEALEAGGYAIGGEQSGHIIYRNLATTGDGLLAGLRLAQFVHDHHSPLADLAASVMHRYPQVLINVRVAQQQSDVAGQLATEIAAAEAELGGEGRVLVRSSGTEPLIRVMVEAATAESADAVANQLVSVVEQRFGSATS